MRIMRLTIAQFYTHAAAAGMEDYPFNPKHCVCCPSTSAGKADSDGRHAGGIKSSGAVSKGADPASEQAELANVQHSENPLAFDSQATFDV